MKPKRPVEFSELEKLGVQDRRALRRVLGNINFKLRIWDGSGLDAWAGRVAMEGDRATRQTFQRSLKGGADFSLRDQYLSEIWTAIRKLRRQLKEGGNPCAILEGAVSLGVLLGEARANDEMRGAAEIGHSVRQGGRKAAIAAHGENTGERYSTYRASFERNRKSGMSKGDAERAAAREHRVSTKTIQTARAR